MDLDYAKIAILQSLEHFCITALRYKTLETEPKQKSLNLWYLRILHRPSTSHS